MLEISKAKQQVVTEIDVEALKARISFNENENIILRTRLKEAKAEAIESRKRIERLEEELGIKPFCDESNPLSSQPHRKVRLSRSPPYDARIEHEHGLKAQRASNWNRVASKVKVRAHEIVQRTAIGELRGIVQSMAKRIADAFAKVSELEKTSNDRFDNISSETYALARELARHQQDYRCFARQNKDIFSRLVENQIKVQSSGVVSSAENNTGSVRKTPCRPSTRPQTAGPVIRQAALNLRPQSSRIQSGKARRPQSARIAIDRTFKDMLALRKELQDSSSKVGRRVPRRVVGRPKSAR